MMIYIKVGRNKKGEKIIKDIKAETLGCIAAITSSSVLTELVKGKTLKESEKITNKHIVKNLGGLPEQKIHCSKMATDALAAAIKDYEKKRNK
jgi:nitrogen fixation NifU-like protein